MKGDLLCLSVYTHKTKKKTRVSVRATGNYVEKKPLRTSMTILLVPIFGGLYTFGRCATREKGV